MRKTTHKFISLLLILSVLSGLCCNYAMASYEEKIDYVSAVLEGKKILFLGDSYTGGRGIDDYADTWCARLGSEYNMEVTCQSINGSTLASTPIWGYWPGTCFFPISVRPMPEGEFDVIFVSCGSNDWNLEIPIGSDMESRDKSCFMGAVNVIIDRVEQEHPEATLIMMTPWMTDGRVTSRGETTDDYASAMRQICIERQVFCFDVTNPLISGIFADSEFFRERYFLTETDPWHLNLDGHKRFLPVAAEWIARIMLADNIFDAGGGFLELRFVDQLIPLRRPYSPWFVVPWLRAE